MANQGLLFIPDISGFTRFVNETDIGHGRMIIQHLLETLMDANQMELEVSEVEGDAILFYRIAERPEMHQLYAQVERMFRDFHDRIRAFEKERACACGACAGAAELTLKVVTHYGEFVGYSVKNFNKIMGKGVIEAHQLLKNDIAGHEYWLATEDLLEGKAPVMHAPWMEWENSAKTTENGTINFHFTGLGELRSALSSKVSE